MLPSIPMRSLVRALWPVLLFPGIYAGCKKEVVAAAVPGSLVLVQGNNQQAQGGTELPNQIVVRVLTVEGAPIEKHPVGFAIGLGGGVVNPGSALSDENGEVKVKWTLGPNDVTQTLRVTAAPVEPLTVSAVALLPTDLLIAQGSNQSAKAGASLPNPIVIRVLGPGNVPMKGITVAFQVMSGGGLISPQSASTNATGEVTGRWTLGASVGVQTLAVSAGSLQPILLQAVAQ